MNSPIGDTRGAAGPVLRASGYVRGMLRTWPFVAALSLAPALRAQVTAGLNGHVADADTRRPLAGAVVEVLLADSVIGTMATDSAGLYRFEALEPGIVALHVLHEGHAACTVPEVWVRAGRTETVDVELAGAGRTLRAVEVEDTRPRRMDAIGTHTITVEQTLRYPATFFDPVRTVDTHAGVARTNDQANHFSVRGNGPGSNAWLLEGAEIVTPNHLTNAGTASDQPVLSGGGVTILSAQMLGTSRLLVGSPDAMYGDALGGIMDMRLRRGANDRAVHTVQAGLIGIDLATEGPFKKGGGASYLVNYRYSTVGLLGAMGVNLGDEVITFQDLSFHVALPFRRGSVSLFGMGGLSSNHFEALEDSTQWVYDKDSQNIDYLARMGAVGGTLRLLGKKAVWTTTAVLSEQDQQRDADGIYMRHYVFSSRDRFDERKLSLVSHVRGTLGKRIGYQAGGSAMERRLFRSFGIEETVAGWLVRPWAQGSVNIGERVRAVLGLAASYWTLNGSAVAEPRLSLTWDMGRRDALMLSAGQRSQLPPVQNYQVSLGTVLDNADIGLIRSQDVSLAVEHAFTEHLVLRAEVFAQRLLDVPVIDTNAFQFFGPYPPSLSMVNEWDGSTFASLSPMGTAGNKGAELSLRQRFNRGLYYHVNGTLLDARYADAYGDEHGSRWNTGFIANAVIGKEFTRRKEKLTRTWGANLRGNVAGGQHYMPAADEGKGPWEGRYATYWRVDLRVYLKREHARRTGMWALDLQNALNTRNEAFRYFDERQRSFVMRYQLGLIPNLSYRIEF